MFIKKALNIMLLLLLPISIVARPIVSQTSMSTPPNLLLGLLAKVGVSSAKFQLASFYFDHKNFNQAKNYFQASYDSGYSMKESQFNIAVCYYNLNNFHTAQKLFKDFALTNTDAKADFMLAMSDAKLGFDKESIAWLKKSAKLGFQPAKNVLKEISK